MDFVALDFETANEKRDSACAIGLTTVRDGVICETVHRLIRPQELRFSHWNTRVHGITGEDVIGCPTLAELWPEIAGYLENQLIIAHNASFDISVLRHSLHAASVPIPRVSYLCSLQLSRQLWPHLASHSLGFLAEVHRIPLEHHNAASDSLAAARLVLLGSQERGVSSLRELAEHCQLTVGEVFSEDEWIPASAPSVRRECEAIEIILPDDFDVSTHPFYQKNIVFTGTLMMFRRDDAHRIVEQFGGCPKPSVSKKTNYLVAGIQDVRQFACGTSESSKLSTAKKLREDGYDVRIITESDFSELVFNPSNVGIAK